MSVTDRVLSGSLAIHYSARGAPTARRPWSVRPFEHSRQPSETVADTPHGDGASRGPGEASKHSTRKLELFDPHQAGTAAREFLHFDDADPPNYGSGMSHDAPSRWLPLSDDHGVAETKLSDTCESHELSPDSDAVEASGRDVCAQHPCRLRRPVGDRVPHRLWSGINELFDDDSRGVRCHGADQLSDVAGASLPGCPWSCRICASRNASSAARRSRTSSTADIW